MNFGPNKRLASLIIVGLLVSTAFLIFVPNEAGATPSFSVPDIDPEYPNATEPVNVSIEISDNQVITSATLYYSYDGITWSSTTMTLTGGGIKELFNETFPSTTINSANWASTSGTPVIKNEASNEPSTPYSLDMDGSGDYITSVIIDLSSYFEVNISFFYEMAGVSGGGGERPDPGDYLYLQYYNNVGSWVNLWSQDGDMQWHSNFVYVEETLPANAYHSNFQFRFRSTGSGTNYDDFYVDNVKVISPGSKANGIIPGPGFSTTVYYYVNATNQIGQESQSLTYSYYADGTTPVIVDWTNITSLKSSEDYISIFTNVTDDYYLDYVLLWYNNGSGWTSIQMNFVQGNDTNATYQADIPSALSETIVDYYIEVLDKASNSNVSIIDNYTTNFPPMITNVMNIPQFPKGSSIVTIFANVTDSDGVSSVTLYYSTDGVTYTSSPMSLVGGDVYNCTIPPTGLTITVYYYIEATDSNGLLRSTPIFTYLSDADLPYFGKPEINPIYPNATVSVNVTMGIVDNADVVNGTLYYTYDGITWYSVSMVDYGVRGTIYDYQVETGPSGWTHYQLSGSAGDNWYISSFNWYSPFNSWHSDQEPGANWGDSCLESPLITNLPFSANLSFWHWYEFYSFPTDGGIVEINDGSGWTQIFPVDGYDNTLNSGWQNPLEGKQAFTSSSGGWQKETFILSAYAGKDVRIRFHIGWNVINDGPREGWYIDNITIYSDIGGWSGIIPGPGFSTWVYYYVVASDQANNLNTSQTYRYYADSVPPIVVDTTTVNSPVATNAQISILANATDNYGFDFNDVDLWYDNGSGWTSVPMTFVSGNYTNATFQAYIPPTITETTVSYYVRIFDNASNAGNSITKNYITNSPPSIDDVTHDPQFPNASSIISVYGNITDIDGISSVTLYYSTDGVTYIPIQMSPISGNLYNVTIPSLGSTIVYFYIFAVDSNGFSNSSPIFNYTIDMSKPEFGTPKINPKYPNATENVNVTISIKDDVNVTKAILWYSYNGVDWYDVQMQGSSGFGTLSNVAIFQNTNPWGYLSNQNILNANGISFSIFSSSDIGVVDLSSYDKVIISSVQDYGTFYSVVEANKAWFESYVSKGGVLEIHGCDQSMDHWNIMPGDITHIHFSDNWISIIDPSHPIITTPNQITDAELDGWSSSAHDYFNSWPADTTIILEGDSSGQPVLIEFPFGSGFIIASTQTLEHGYQYGYSDILENIILYYPQPDFNGTIPGPGFPTMVYYYINATDASGNFNESSIYSYFAGSDLVLNTENITFIPTSPLENGTAIFINSTVYNAGGSVIGVEVRFYDGDPDKDKNNVIDAGAKEIGTPSVIDVQSDSVAFASTIWTPSERKFYNVYIWVDAVNATWEWNEWNNLASNTIDVYDWLDDFLNETKIEYKYNVEIINDDVTLLNTGSSIYVNGTYVYYNIGGWGTYEYFAQSIVATDPYISLIGTYIGGDSSPYPDMRVQFWGDLGGNPDRNNVIASSDVIDGSTITWSGQRYYINFSTPLQVTVGQTYWIVIDGYYDYNTTGDCKGRYSSGNYYPDGIFKRSSNGGASWSIPSTSYDLDFIVQYYNPVSDGNLRSVEITLPIGKKWETLYINKTEPANSYIQVSLVNGTTDVPITGFVDITDKIIDITSIDPDIYPSIKLVGKLFGDGMASPILHYWAVNWVPGPSAYAGPDDIVNEDFVYTFDASGSWSGIGIASYAWDIDASDGVDWDHPDYKGPNLWNPAHIYYTPGIYVVTLNVTDINGYWDIDTMILTVIDTTPPVANGGPNREIDEDSPHTFDASASWDNSGNITSYIWDMDDSDGVDWNNPDYTGVSPIHTFTEPETYIVTLKVTDATGNSKLDTIKIVVKDITAPFADAGLDGSINEDDTYYFDGSRSTDNVGIIFYNWTFGDGSYQFGTNMTPFHTYSSKGMYVITLKVTDMAGNWNEDSLTIFVNNVAPVADAGEDQFIDAGQSVNFNGSKSWDTPSDIPSLIYVWYFGDGFVGAGKVTSHTYTTPGVYNVILEVTDDDGAKSSDTIIITIRDATWPTAKAGQDDSVDQNMPYQFDGSASTDDVGITKYQWDIDDSDGVDWTSPDYEEVSPTHVYTEPGDYVVTLRVIDTDGNFDTDTVTITVLKTWPTAKAGQDDTVDQNKPYQFDGSASTDNEGIAKYQWDIDDSDGVDWTSPDYEGVSPTHIYTKPGDYIVTLRVIDTDGNFDTDTITITVLETPPTAKAGQNDTVDQNKPYRFDGGASTDDVGITKYQWDMDDSDGVNWTSPDYEVVSPTHVFTEPGDYVVTLRVIDTDGNFDTDTITITVLEVTVEETIPSPPTNLEVSLLPQNDALEISWKAPTTNEDGSALTDLECYEIFYWDFLNLEFKKLIDVPASMTSYVHSGLMPNSIYYYYVVAVDRDSSRSQPSVTVCGIPNKDTDGDQIPDITDDDDDNDGYPDIMEITGGSDPQNALSKPPDNDDDFISDFMDPDDDNDGHPDLEDDYPLDPERWKKAEMAFDWLWILLGLIVILLCIIGLLVWKTYRGLEKEPQEVQPKEKPVAQQKGLREESRGFPPPPPPEETQAMGKKESLPPPPPPPPPTLSLGQDEEPISQEEVKRVENREEKVEGAIADEPNVAEQQPPQESEMEKEVSEVPKDKSKAQGEMFPFPPPPPPLFTEKIEESTPQEDLKDVEEDEEEVEWIIEEVKPQPPIEENTTLPAPPPLSAEQTYLQKDLENGEESDGEVEWIFGNEQSSSEQSPKENPTEEELPEQTTDEPEEKE